MSGPEQKLEAAWTALVRGRPGFVREMMNSETFDWAVREYMQHPLAVYSSNLYHCLLQRAAGQPVVEHVRSASVAALLEAHATPAGHLPPRTVLPLCSDAVFDGGGGALGSGRGAAHWSVAVLDDTGRWLLHADSMPGQHARMAAGLLELAVAERWVPADTRLHAVPCARQTDGWTCGYHALRNTLALAVGREPPAAAAGLDQFVGQMLAAARAQRETRGYAEGLLREWFPRHPRFFAGAADKSGAGGRPPKP